MPPGPWDHGETAEHALRQKLLEQISSLPGGFDGELQAQCAGLMGGDRSISRRVIFFRSVSLQLWAGPLMASLG